MAIAFHGRTSNECNVFAGQSKLIIMASMAEARGCLESKVIYQRVLIAFWVCGTKDLESLRQQVNLTPTDVYLVAFG